MTDPVMVLIFGLPGSGKSTLTDELVRDMLRTNAEKRNPFLWYPCVIRYDDIIGHQEQVETVSHRGLAKHHRLELLSGAEALIAWVTGRDADRPEMPRWGVLRREISRPAVPGERPAFLVDDTLYYRSMRHAWFRVAQKASLRFCQVFVHCPLEEALRRNKRRSAPVPDLLIRRMASRLEEPRNSPWELHHMAVSDGSDRCRVLEVIATAPVAVVAPVTETATPSIVHLWDLALRRAVSRLVRDAASGDDGSRVTDSVVQVRRELMVWARSEGSALPPPPEDDEVSSLLRAHLSRYLPPWRGRRGAGMMMPQDVSSCNSGQSIANECARGRGVTKQ